MVLALLMLAMLTASAHADDDKAQQVDLLFAEWNKPDSPGVAVAVIKDGEILYKAGYGMANLEYDIPITPSTIFDIASVSKQFCAFAISMLVEEGKLSLDDDIRIYLPELQDVGHTVTIRHLVHHTGGYRDWPKTLSVAGWRFDDVISFEQILKFARHQKHLNTAPGTEYNYSNTGYNLLAETVSRVTGKTFREWTDENIFKPLGMTSTHFHDDHTEVVKGRAYSYHKGNDGRYYKRVNTLTALGSSSLYTTVEDLAKWERNFIDAKVGGPAVVKRLYQQEKLNNGREISYAFGLVRGNHRGLENWGHGGSWAGVRTNFVRFPQQKLAVALFSNLAGFSAGSMALKVAEIYLEDEMKPVETADESQTGESYNIDPEILPDYEGTYQLAEDLLVDVIREGNNLTAQATGQPKFTLRPVAEHTFDIRAVDATLKFAVPEVDKSPYFDLIMNGQERQAMRIELAPLTKEEMAAYTGEYYSAELDTTYRLVIAEGKLVAKHFRNEDTMLTHIWKDHFTADKWWFNAVFFQRDSGGKINGFEITQGRVKHLRFDKQN